MPDPGRTALYRLFDANDRLLYVGISTIPAERFTQHAADKTWWPEVCRKEITWHRTRQAALKAELRAIKKESPAHNSAGVIAPGALRWNAKLQRRAVTISRRKRELKQDIAAARLAGHPFRDIGRWANLNHERARQICIDINGHSRTQAELDAAATEAADQPDA